MKKLLVLGILIVIVMSFSSCKKDDTTIIGDTTIVNDKTMFNEELAKSNDNKQDEETKKETEEKPTNADNIKKSDSQSTSKYAQLSNKLIGWGLGRNKEHKTPSIPNSWRELIDKYNGLFVGDVNQKVVYLTFDEGYENGYTSKILDVLKADNVKGTFFVTAPYVRKNPELIQRMLDEGHIVGNHTVNHPSLPSKSIEDVEKEVIELDRLVYEKWKVNMTYMRPPRGEISERVLAQLDDLGYRTVMWSFAYKDYDINNQPSKEYAYKLIMDNLHPGAIYLLHAVSKTNAEVLDSVIKGIRAQGYVIKSLDSIK